MSLTREKMVVEGLLCVMSESPGSGAGLQAGHQLTVTLGSHLPSLCLNFFFCNTSLFLMEFYKDLTSRDQMLGAY